MSDIAANIIIFSRKLPESVKLIAVSKTRTVNDIKDAYSSGQRRFGENRVQELLIKKDHLPVDTEWHMIGHLQSNKVKFIIPFISLIQSVDSLKLLKTINAEAFKINRVIDCLLQLYIATEETKYGFSMEELTEAIESKDILNLSNIRICGIMGMASLTSETDQVRKEFRYLSDCYKSLKKRYFSESPFFKEISMGMSGDFEIAIEEGSTMVRIGSLIFGERIII